MPFESPLSALKDAAQVMTGARKVTQLRLYPANAVSTWDTGTLLISYYLPPNRVMIPDRCGISDVVNIAAPAAGLRAILNPAVNNRWLSARLSISGTEVLNVSNLNVAYNRCVSHACTSAEKFYTNSRIGKTLPGVGVFGAPSPSQALGGLTILLTQTAAAAIAVTPAQIIAENRYVSSFYTGAVTSALVESFNTPAECYLASGVATASSYQSYTDFSDFYGTCLAIPQGLPTGSGSVLEFVQDSVSKSIRSATLPELGAGLTLVNVAVNEAFAAAPATTLTNHFLKLTCLANDGIDNSESAWYRENEGVEINLPYIDSINQSAGNGTSYSTNMILPAAGRNIRAICSAVVLSGVTDPRATQCNGSNGSTVGGLLTARGYINSVPDTSDVLRLSDTSLASYMISNALRGSMLQDATAFMNHPVYVSNLTGMSLVDLHKPINVLSETGVKFDTPITFQLEGTQDAVARQVQVYILSSRKAKLMREGIMMQ